MPPAPAPAAKRTNTFILLGIAGVFGAALIVLLIVAGMSTGLLGGSAAPPPTARTVTMDGHGPSGELDVPVINLWDNYQTRSKVVAQVKDGEQVLLIGRDGTGCQVQTSAGVRGWVTCSNFIKELR